MFGKILNYEKTKNGIKIHFEKECGTLTVINEKTLHIYADCGTSHIRSKAVISKEPEEISFAVEREEDAIVVKTAALTAKIYDDFRVDIYDATGKPLCMDYRKKREPKVTASPEAIALMQQEGHEVKAAKEHYKIEVVKDTDAVEAFYGLGDQTGFLNKKGYAYELWNTDNPMPHVDSFKTLYKSIPFFIAKKEKQVYGIFFDNTCRSYWDFCKESREYFYFAADDGNLNYYFYAGEGIREIVAAYTAMTGTVPLPQLWTLGYQQSRWGYESRADILEVAEKFRKYKIPCDAIHFDIDYMEQFKVFTFSKEHYGEPKELMEELLGMGIKPVVILDPGVKVEKGYEIYEEGKKKGYFVTDEKGSIYENVVWPGDAVYPDFGRKQVRDWWAEKEKYLIDLGVCGIWNDMNEPASFHGEIPQEIVFSDEDTKSTHGRMHNVYGHLMSKAAYDGLKKWDKKRPFVITRACYAGSQRYATAWTGDNHSIWAHLQMAIPQLCNLGMSGMGFVGTDIGGFGSDTTAELICRWVQVGAFSPLCRNHSSKGWIYQEPWQFDETTLKIYKKFIELRYQLLPYFYDCFYEMQKTGAPVFRPLVFSCEDDKNTWEINDEFMVGGNLLVAPVVMQGATKKMVYLPKGDWVDLETRETVKGGSYFVREAPLHTCPVYVKAGTILPTYPVQQYVGEQEITELTVHIFPGNGTYLHYEDDGSTFAYKEGVFNLYEMSIAADGMFEIKVRANGYPNGTKTMRLLWDGKEKVISLDQEFLKISLR